MNLADLKKPFEPGRIHWRLDQVVETQRGPRGRALCYLNARDVMERLDEVCGPENWQSRIEVHGDRVLCSLGIRCGDDWVWKTDGAGNTQVEAEKGGISDALKRAAVCWGIGRYLYEIESPWVGLEAKGRSRSGKPNYFIPDAEKARLETLLPGSTVEAGPEPPPPQANGQAKPFSPKAIEDMRQRIAAADSMAKLAEIDKGLTDTRERFDDAVFEELKTKVQERVPAVRGGA